MDQQAADSVPADGNRFDIAGWQVDPASLRIRNERETIKLEPKAMAVLEHLVSRQGAVVSRQELEDTIWAGTVVGYDALSNAIIKLRKAFGDDARNPRIIETIAKTGYRLIADVESLSPQTSGKSADKPAGEHDRDSRIQSADLSVAVLPFDNMSGDAEQEYFSDGISEDITTDLSKISGLMVIARNSAFAYKGSSKKIDEISSELGVRYVLEGSVRKSGQKVRINAQMIDAITGGHVWAERYDRDLTDIFSVQDQVTRDIVAAIAPSLLRQSEDNTSSRKAPNFEAYEYFLKGRELVLLDTEESTLQAHSLLQKAAELDPTYSAAYSYLARCYALGYINNWGDATQQSMAKALELGRIAAELDHKNPHAHFTICTAALWLKMNDLALQEIEIALSIDPNFSEGHAALSMIRIYSGEPEKALESLEVAMRLDPLYRDIYLHLEAQAHFHLGHYAQAVESLKRRLIRKPESDVSRVLLASCYGHLGKLEKGRIEWDAALRANPNYSIEQKRQKLPYQNPADFDHIVAGLTKAGLLDS